MAARRHARHRAARPGPRWTRSLRLAAPGAGGPIGRPTALLVAATAFVAGAVTQVTWHQVETDSALRVQAEAQVVAVQVAAEHRLRVDSAATSRLSGQATVYLAHLRTQARDAAQGAIDAAGALSTSSSDVLKDEDLTELDLAVAELAALLESTPDAQDALDRAAAEAAALTVTPAVEVVAEAPSVGVLAVTPLNDALELVSPDAPRAVENGAADPSALLAGQVAVPAPGATSTDPAGTVLAMDAPAADAAGTSVASGTTNTSNTSNASSASDISAVITGDEVMASDVLPTDVTAKEAVAAPSAADLKAAPDVVPPAALLAAADLDRTESERLLKVAQRVLDLSAEVQVVADQARADLAAQQAVEAASQAEAERVASRVAAADRSPNGAIPEAYLCGVDFGASVLLRCDAALALEHLDEAYRAETGRDLRVVSSYRTASSQEVLHDEKGDLAAAPGMSNHGRGLAVDLAGAGDLGVFDAPVYLWLVEHAEDFGWHHPSYMDPGGSGPLEPWHWEFGTQD